MLAPLPFLKVVPTNGITEDNAASWIEAGAFALGWTAALFTPGDLAARNYAAIEARARAILDSRG